MQTSQKRFKAHIKHFNLKVFYAGQLKQKFNLWKSLGAPRTILNVLNGYRIPFISKPPLVPLNLELSRKFEPKSCHLMQNQITELLKLGVISENYFQTGFMSPIFLRSKTNGSHRLIFNLKNLNLYIKPLKFRLINLSKVSKIIQRGDYMVKLDISNAYYHIPIKVSHRRFLTLAFKNKIFNMNCLPFGLSSAPSMFAKLSNWTANLLRNKDIRTIVYLDDFLLLNQDPLKLREQANWAFNFLQSLGWHINFSKSDLTPKRIVDYLGLMWNTERNLKYLPPNKIENIKSIINKISRKHKWNWVEAKHLLGKLNFAANAIPLGALHCRKIQISANKLQERNKFKYIPLSNQVTKELLWWTKHLIDKTPIQLAPPSIFITTDASNIGWGAIINTKRFSGNWTPIQRNWHCNQKEFYTLYAVLKANIKNLQRKSIIFQTDNRTTASYIRRQGGTRSIRLLDLAHKILTLCHRYKITIIPKYLPGKYNGLADGLSRRKLQQEWHLSPTIRALIFQKMGTPEIDLFASNRSAIVPRYVSEDARDKNSEFTNAFSRPWLYKLAWIFPPPALIPYILQHLNTSQGTFILVAPKWNRAFWTPDLKKRAVCAPFRIRNLRNHLRDLTTNRPPREIDKMTLLVWKIRAGTN